MTVKEIIKILFNYDLKTTSSVDHADVRRIDGEFVMNDKLFTFKAYSIKSKEDQTISGLSPMIRIDIKEKEPF
jgi:hypothetical protein